jgi:phosphoribosylamine--glycine ligase
MNILLLGSGGREHALALNMSKSPLCDQLFIAPGNVGTSSCGTNVAINPTDFKGIESFVLKNDIQIVIVGPEAPLVDGIYDYFKNKEQLKSINVVGPSAEGAKLEGSKAYAKKFMASQNIPTAGYEEFTIENLENGLAYIKTQTPPIVLKADGLAAGKGVLICQSIEEAQTEFKKMLEGKFGDAGSTVVIEEFLDGIEFSVFVITDGKEYKILPIAKDYKRIGEGDTGLNTGGMGAVSPVPFVDEIIMKKVENRVIKPTIAEIQKRNIEYKGFIFLGLIMVKNEPFVIEYNCRMGDPETEVVIPRLQNDLVELFNALDNNTLKDIEIKIDERAATTIMLVSGGYPEAYEKGETIHGISDVKDSIVFHAGTKSEDGQILTNGGRVLAVTSFGKDFREALKISNKNAQLIGFEGKYYRTDIGFDL